MHHVATFCRQRCSQILSQRVTDVHVLAGDSNDVGWHGCGDALPALGSRYTTDVLIIISVSCALSSIRFNAHVSCRLSCSSLGRVSPAHIPAHLCKCEGSAIPAADIAQPLSYGHPVAALLGYQGALCYYQKYRPKYSTPVVLSRAGTLMLAPLTPMWQPGC